MSKARLRTLNCALVVVFFAVISSASPAHSFSVREAPDSYTRIDDAALKEALLTTLAAADVSTTGNFHQLAVPGEAFDGKRTSLTVEAEGAFLHIVQDRGLPRGDLFPTFVLKPQAGGDALDLILKTEAGTKVYYADGQPESGCLFSAKKAYSDICLVDVSGKPAPELPGLRNDIWTDLIRLLGL